MFVDIENYFSKKNINKIPKVSLKTIRKLFCFSVLFQCHFIINKFNTQFFMFLFEISYCIFILDIKQKNQNYIDIKILYTLDKL